MSTIFTKIVTGEIPSYKIAETDDFYAFLDINPLAKGHTLVIPKKEIDYILDMDDKLHSELWNFAKKIGKAVEKVIPCERIGITVIGLEVPHTHIHIIPINSIYDMDFKRDKLQLEASEFMEIAKSISKEYTDL
jgi:histidine triad (HIT) family protein